MKSAIAALILFCAWPASAQMQISRGSIQGTVLDSSGAAIPGAHVTVRQEDSGFLREANTDVEGAFRFTGLQVGSYEVRVEQSGFGTAIIKNLNVSVGQVVVQRLELKPADVAERLDVHEQADALETAATSASVALGNERVEETPSQNRNFLNIVLTAPGVASSSGSNAQRSAAALRSPNTDSGFSFGGMRGRNNSLSIDGVDNRDETTGGNRVAVGLEMVKEFRVSGTSFAAESGGAAGGAVNLVTLSGTNKWHGDGTYFTQNEFANARNPEAGTNANPRFRRYQPGASLNGPIRRDQTFFSLALEQEWESGEEWSDTPKRLAGIKSPLSSVVPYRGLFPTDSSQTEFSFKANHQIGRHSFSGRYAFSRGRAHNDVQDVDNFTDQSARGSSLTHDHSFVAEWVSVITPTLVNDLRGQFSQRDVVTNPNAPGPMIEIPGVLTFGQSYRLDAQRTERHGEIVESIHIARRRHQLSLGASIHVVRLNSRIANRFGGIQIFPTFESFITGVPDVSIQAFGDPHTQINTIPLGFYAQDSWQVGKGLTVDFGARYDYQRMPEAIPSTTRNLAPRIGIAWHPAAASSFVFRAGFGVFYDRYPLGYLNEAIQKDGVRAYEIYAAAGVPSVRTFYRPAEHFPATYSRKFTAGGEKSFGKDTTLSVEYSSVEGHNLPRIRSIGPNGAPRYQLEQTAKSSYDGVSFALNKRLSKEWALLVTYALSSTHDDASDYDEQPFNPSNIGIDWALSRQHQRQRFSTSAVFEPIDHVTFAPIFTVGSGRPLNALDTTDTLRTGAYPISARPFGLPRNPFFTPGTASFDSRLMYTIPVHEKRAVLQFGAECFNILNHTNPLRVSPYYAAEGQKLSSYRGIVETLNARQIQFFMQFEY